MYCGKKKKREWKHGKKPTIQNGQNWSKDLSMVKDNYD